MADLNAIVTQAISDAADGTLDLTAWSENRFDHAELVAASTLAWWLLSRASGVSRVRLPEADQKVFFRSGLVAVCDSVGIDYEVEAAVAKGDQLFPPGTVGTRSVPVPPRVYVPLPDLAHASNRPPDPDEHGRRYTWVGDLISPNYRRLGPRDRTYAGGDAARSLFEFVDNVHRWANAGDALGVVSMSHGGGEESFDRMHIVVMDDGRGIISSVLADRSLDQLPASVTSDDLTTLLEHFMRVSFGKRDVPKHNGHGLHVAQLLAKAWIGRIDLLSADERYPGLVHRARSTVRDGIEGCESFMLPGIRGTLVEITLNLTIAPEHREAITADEEHEQQELFAQFAR